MTFGTGCSWNSLTLCLAMNYDAPLNGICRHGERQRDGVDYERLHPNVQHTESAAGIAFHPHRTSCGSGCKRRRSQNRRRCCRLDQASSPSFGPASGSPNNSTSSLGGSRVGPSKHSRCSNSTVVPQISRLRETLHGATNVHSYGDFRTSRARPRGKQ